MRRSRSLGTERYRDYFSNRRAQLSRARRARHKPMVACATYENLFTPKRTGARYCSAACKQRAYRHRVHKAGAGTSFK
jgi:hypothetical protein